MAFFTVTTVTNIASKMPFWFFTSARDYANMYL